MKIQFYSRLASCRVYGYRMAKKERVQCRLSGEGYIDSSIRSSQVVLRNVDKGVDRGKKGSEGWRKMMVLFDFLAGGARFMG